MRTIREDNMEKEKMLVTSALNELKLLDARITDKIEFASFVASAKKSSDKVEGFRTKKQFINNSVASLQSIKDLIERRRKIKAAIVASNAVTEVEIGGVKMTVADAIERKTSIKYDNELLISLQSQFGSAKVKLDRENKKVSDSIDKMLETAYGKDSKDKVTEGMYSAIADPYRNANEYEMVEGFDTEKTINDLKDNIDTFLSEVDTKLQVSNSTTLIEF